MAGPELNLSMKMSQTLAPQLQQSLQLLQVSALELQSLVQQELEMNPVLEDATINETDTEKDEKAEKEDEIDKEIEQLAKLDEEWRDYMQTSTVNRNSAEDEEKRQFFFDSLVEHESLEQHLLNQLKFSDLPKQQIKIAELIIGNIDERGFLTVPLEEISTTSGVLVEKLEKLLETIQSFHPVGVGARDLRECLLIQLNRLGKSESLEAAIVSKFINELSNKRLPEIGRALGIDVSEIQKAATFISTLSPRPGAMFTADPNQYIVPDVEIRKVDGDYVILLNDEQVPHLRISNTYKDLMASNDKADVKNYIRDKIRAGKFLIKSIHQRQQTIQNIAREILNKQKEFFEKGISQLKPLTMAQIAEIVGVHETTVSRAIANKYIQTPQGIFEMKYFFTPGFTSETGESISNSSIKDAINDLIKNENHKQPLSDQEIVQILLERGIHIARRTVAKYRQELGILPSNLRRSF
ncbi:MAG: RNA polymerase factor sigma-54 [Verrucomicrobiota bacterium]|nr:RNA polymerase factor sigma-54 [Verrucomicrobiota bacterium]